MTTTRVRADADMDGCIEVLGHVYATDGYPVQGLDHARQFLTEGIEQAWVAVNNGKIIGHAAVSPATDSDVSVVLWRRLYPGKPSIAVLGRLFVDPEQRGSGAATYLLEAADSWSEHARCRLVLFALEKDQVAMKVYKRRGWTEYGTVPYHYGGGKEMAAVCFVNRI
ncbi:hypothetical protein LTR62_001638 [Meristemomyces frigidus]|uniref:N-acetyltransferase domain-containing protein n=1 Tax=Meristemomyces frigidus TaxID=1508187 RepID=A0AAN7YMA5_9PEZI|nr:hypothetical protein LTR62_001638 [Meristemomyces frigidus]